ncbi:hypothetical protein [Pseudomonas mediterranea]|jgi:hypothetical protein|uniref:hypothetical protein n=1 Tax=Pseudomonas mediterranea TaxID=183795 RepID=UPI000A6ABEAB|nr:hypothetical protein [Pseudomonas mediterranea]
MTMTFDFPYIRVGSLEAFVERVSPAQRGHWFTLERDAQGTLLGFLWWDVQLNRV